MTELNTQAPITELTEDQLEAVEGGGVASIVAPIVLPYILDEIFGRRG